MQSASLFFVPGFILFVLFVWCSGRQSAVPEHLIKKNYGSRSKKGEFLRFELSHNALNRKPRK